MGKIEIGRDPVEKTEDFKKAMKIIQPKLDEMFKGEKSLGTCHRIWAAQKQMLLEYGIVWRSPAEMNNTYIVFD